MKLFLLIFFLFVYVLDSNGFFNSKEKYKKTILSGYTNEKKDSISLSILNMNTYLDLRDSYILVLVVSNNTFKCEIDLENPVMVYGITPGAYPIILEPGDNFSYTLGKFDFNSYENGARKMNCVFSIMRNYWLFEEGNSNNTIERYDSIKNMVIKSVNIYEGKISSIAEGMIKAIYLPSIADVVIGNRAILNEKNRKKILQCIDDYFQLIDLNDSALLFSVGVVDKITKCALLRFSLKENESFEDILYAIKFAPKHYYALKENLPNSILKKKILANYLIESFESKDFNLEFEGVVRNFLAEFKFDSTNSFYKAVKENYIRATTFLARGARAFEFSLEDTSGRIKTLNDFRGKVILMDFMFTGCGGCMQIAPYLSNLESEFHKSGKVVFLSVSVDKDKEKWKKSSASGVYAPKKSIHLITNGDGPYCSITFHYNIVGYPTLVLIDQEGNLLTSRAPDPRIDKGDALRKLILNAITVN